MVRELEDGVNDRLRQLGTELGKLVIPAAAGDLAPAAAASERWYLVTCRLDGEDEDSAHTYYVASAAEAVTLAEEDEREEAGEADESEDERRPFYRNFLIDCGQCEPKVLKGPEQD